MSNREKMVCKDCKANELEKRIFPVSTFKAIDERYDFPYEYKDETLCVHCAKERYLTKGFITETHRISLDYYYNENDMGDVVHLDGVAILLPIKKGMYVLKYEDSYWVSPDLKEDEFDSQELYWDAIEKGRKDVPVSILVLINGKTIIGKGSIQHRILIEEIIQDYENRRLS